MSNDPLPVHPLTRDHLGRITPTGALALAYLIPKGIMLTAYIQAAMRRAHYELLANGEGYYCEIPDLQGVWANAQTLEACRDELQSVLEEWILLGLKLSHSIPVIDDIDLNLRVEAA